MKICCETIDFLVLAFTPTPSMFFSLTASNSHRELLKAMPNLCFLRHFITLTTLPSTNKLKVFYKLEFKLLWIAIGASMHQYNVPFIDKETPFFLTLQIRHSENKSVT